MRRAEMRNWMRRSRRMTGDREHLKLPSEMQAMQTQPSVTSVTARTRRRAKQCSQIMILATAKARRFFFGAAYRSALFWLSFFVLLWLAHAAAYLLHEFGHSFTAWITGYKANPLALDYGHLNAGNLLFQSEIDENVEYDPVFAAGKGFWAASIAGAGVLVNVVLYFASRALYFLCKRRSWRMAGLFAFLFCLMNVGNFLDYVPVRTFATHGDMATLERGLHISPWWVAVAAGVPFAVAIWHFFRSMLPEARRGLFPNMRLRQATLVLASSFMMFGYYGAAGMQRYGEISHWISLFSFAVVFPGVLILCWPRKGELERAGQAAR